MKKKHLLDKSSQDKSSQPRDHLANERTFLAWIRTSIGIMAFGFVVEKFALFIRQIAFLLAKENEKATLPSSLQGYSSSLGAFLVAFGVLLCLFAFVKYKRVEKEIENHSYQPTTLLNSILAFVVVLIGIFLVFYLNISTL